MCSTKVGHRFARWQMTLLNSIMLAAILYALIRMTQMNRRELIKHLAMAGIAAPVLLRAIVTLVDDKTELTLEALKQAQWISGVEMSDEEMEEVVVNVNSNSSGLEQIREIELDYSVPLAIHFSPITTPEPVKQLDRTCVISDDIAEIPETDEEIAFLPVVKLAQLVKQKKISSVRLTNILPSPFEEIRASVAQRCYVYRRARSRTSQASGQRDCGGQISWAASWNSVGSQGFNRGPGFTLRVGAFRTTRIVSSMRLRQSPNDWRKPARYWSRNFHSERWPWVTSGSRA